jgi:hypothetical protein
VTRRGKSGTIAGDHGVFVFADTSVYSLGEKPQHLYSVRFSARELWGDEAALQDAVYLDLCDSDPPDPRSPRADERGLMSRRIANPRIPLSFSVRAKKGM